MCAVLACHEWEIYSCPLQDVQYASAKREIAKFNGELTVFRLRKQPYWQVRDRALGWGTYAHDVRVEVLSGTDHRELFREPHVGELAERIQACLSSPPGE